MKQLPDGSSHLLRLARGGSNDARSLIGSFVGGGNGARFRDGGHPSPVHGGVRLLLQRPHVPSGGGRVPHPSHPPVGGGGGPVTSAGERSPSRCALPSPGLGRSGAGPKTHTGGRDGGGGAEKEGSGGWCKGQRLREWHATRPDAGGSRSTKPHPGSRNGWRKSLLSSRCCRGLGYEGPGHPIQRRVVGQGRSRIVP